MMGESVSIQDPVPGTEGSERNNPSAPDTAVRHKERQLGFNVLSFRVLRSSDLISSGTKVK